MKQQISYSTKNAESRALKNKVPKVRPRARPGAHADRRPSSEPVYLARTMPPSSLCRLRRLTDHPTRERFVVSVVSFHRDLVLCRLLGIRHLVASGKARALPPLRKQWLPHGARPHTAVPYPVHSLARHNHANQQRATFPARRQPTHHAAPLGRPLPPPSVPARLICRTASLVQSSSEPSETRAWCILAAPPAPLLPDPAFAAPAPPPTEPASPTGGGGSDCRR